MERALYKLVCSSSGGAGVEEKEREVKKETGGEIFSEPTLIPEEPSRPEVTSVLPNRPERQVPGK
jgi:hypothetical protein